MKVSAIIPAFNEEKLIGGVLEVVTACSKIDEIIVVSDGSTDDTAKVAKHFPIKVIELPQNRGKGGAMQEGFINSTGDILFFLDADLIGLTVEHLHKMLEPILLDENIEMTIGIFEGGRPTTDWAQFIAPFLSGQRVMKRDLFERLNGLEMTRFGVEVSLTRYARINNIPYKKIILDNMSHVMKEEKLGYVRGFMYRLQMYYEILRVIFLKKIS